MPEPVGIDTGVYLLTPTHCGTGQAAGAVDLPIAREQHTGHPLLPATALKGVAREHAERAGEAWSKDKIEELFGPELGPGESSRLKAGSLVFTDGRLLAFPVRSMQAAFFWVTCPLAIERWSRARRALGLRAPEPPPMKRPAAATFSLQGNLVLEDLLLTQAQVSWSEPALQAVAASWSRLLPGTEQALRQRFQERLVCVRDEDFADLVDRTTPVNARVHLTPGKTTDTWTDPDTKETWEGNLWYEETLPSDCLFSVLIAARQGSAQARQRMAPLLAKAPVLQIGGNETVGQGFIRWTSEEATP